MGGCGLRDTGGRGAVVEEDDQEVQGGLNKISSGILDQGIVVP